MSAIRFCGKTWLSSQRWNLGHPVVRGLVGRVDVVIARKPGGSWSDRRMGVGSGAGRGDPNTLTTTCSVFWFKGRKAPILGLYLKDTQHPIAMIHRDEGFRNESQRALPRSLRSGARRMSFRRFKASFASFSAQYIRSWWSTRKTVPSWPSRPEPSPWVWARTQMRQ